MRVQTKAALALVLLTSTSPSLFAQVAGTSESAGNVERFRRIVPALLRDAKIQPGQTVVIRGNAALIPVMEELAYQAQQAGAHVIAIFTTNRLERNLAADIPDSYLVSAPTPIEQALNTQSNIVFYFPSSVGTNPFAGLPAQRTKAFAQRDSLWKPYYSQQYGVAVNIPTPGDTAGTGLSFEQLAARRWSGMTADYSRIAATATALRGLLENARSIRLTSGEGTDLTFSALPNSASIEAGPALVRRDKPQPVRWSNLPGGQLLVIPRVESAHGKIHAPRDKCDVAVTDEAMDVVAGRAENVTAGSDEACVRTAVSGTHLALLAIGLNPNLSAASDREAISLLQR